MAVNRKKARRRRRLIQAVIGGPFRLRKRSRATPSTQTGDETGERPQGVLRFESNEWRLPEGLAEAGETESNGFMPGGVVWVILILSIIFIAIMTWFVAQMPEK